MKRITDAYPSWAGNEYASVCPFGKDCDALLILYNDRFGLHYGDGQYMGMFPPEISASCRPRWSRTNPMLFTYFLGNTLKQWDVESMTSTIVATFLDYTTIDDTGEADISQDGNHRVICGTRQDGGGKEVFVYDLQSGTSGPIYRQYEAFDGLKISAANEIILSRHDGMFVVGPTLRKIAGANGHAAMGVYQGKPVMLWCSSNDPQVNANAVVMVDVETAIMTILATFSWKLAMHISVSDAGFCLVSVFAPDNSLPTQLWKVFLAGGPPELICDTDGDFRGYNSEPKASVSRDGSRFVFSSNNGAHAGDSNYVDAYYAEL